MRIGVLQDHEHNFPLLDSNWKTAGPEPPKKALKSHEGIGLVGNEVGVGEVSVIPKGAEERSVCNSGYRLRGKPAASDSDEMDLCHIQSWEPGNHPDILPFLLCLPRVNNGGV